MSKKFGASKTLARVRYRIGMGKANRRKVKRAVRRLREGKAIRGTWDYSHVYSEMGHDGG